MSAELPPIVVMGVSAVGKSSVGRALAARLNLPFVDADDLHPPANVAKMHSGQPLDDDDRRPWLDEVGRVLADRPSVIACSALARRYRDSIRAHAPETFFVHLTGDPALLAERARARVGHFMPPSLLASQLAVLEPLEPDESGMTLDVAASVADLAAAAAERIHPIAKT